MKAKQCVLYVVYLGILLFVGWYNQIYTRHKPSVSPVDNEVFSVDSLSIGISEILGPIKEVNVEIDDEWQEGKNGVLQLSDLPQVADQEESITELLRTRLFCDFICRFNGDSITLAALRKKVNFSSHGIENERIGIILSLCNDAEALRSSELNTFARYIVENNWQIDTHKNDYAVVTTLVYKDASSHYFPIRLTFRSGWIRENVEVWYIKGAESPYFDSKRGEKDYYIDSAEKEVGFMGMGEAAGVGYQSLAGENFRMDELSLFLFLNAKQYITYVCSLETCFVVELGEYLFEIEYLNLQEHARSGWMITKIMHQGRFVFVNQ